jgi:dipeptidyl aminopeptidase/acylaminoacyl peptidase
MLNGIHCRGEGSGCPVANPPLPGSDAPQGYQDYYLRDNENATYTATVTAANAEIELEPEEFNLAFAGASPDLRHLVLSTCAALTPNATEVPASEGCDPAKPNLYQWSEGQLALVNVAPGATLASRSDAVSTDGSRVYFTEAGALWLREGSGSPHELAAAAAFQTAIPDGSLAFFTTEEAPGELHLFRYKTATHSAESVATKIKGVLGASADGQTVYYQGESGLVEWHEGATTTVAPGAEAALESDYPSSTGTARVSPDGARLLFLSMEELTGYDNHDAASGKPDSEAFLWNRSGGGLICVSCNPTGERPAGPSSISGPFANGQAPGSTDTYKPRNLSATQNRVFFESQDSLLALDTNRGSDVYQLEAQGTGTCTPPGGCLNLISNGKDPEGASFLDASESGADAYFLTSSSLDETRDPGSADVYDARAGGGFPEPEAPIECIGDACVPLPAPPEDPTVGSLIAGLPNPPVHFPKVHRKCPKGKHSVTVRGKPKCTARHHKKKRGRR